MLERQGRHCRFNAVDSSHPERRISKPATLALAAAGIVGAVLIGDAAGEYATSSINPFYFSEAAENGGSAGEEPAAAVPVPEPAPADTDQTQPHYMEASFMPPEQNGPVDELTIAAPRMARHRGKAHRPTSPQDGSDLDARAEGAAVPAEQGAVTQPAALVRASPVQDQAPAGDSGPSAADAEGGSN